VGSPNTLKAGLWFDIAVMNVVVISELLEKKWHALCESLGLKDDEGAISDWWNKLQ
jgi:hypothetical protein